MRAQAPPGQQSPEHSKSQRILEAQDLCWSLGQPAANALAACLWPGCDRFSSKKCLSQCCKLSGVRSSMYDAWAAAGQLPSACQGERTNT